MTPAKLRALLAQANYSNRPFWTAEEGRALREGK
jgi:hypothetical protein